MCADFIGDSRHMCEPIGKSVLALELCRNCVEKFALENRLTLAERWSKVSIVDGRRKEKQTEQGQRGIVIYIAIVIYI